MPNMSKDTGYWVPNEYHDILREEVDKEVQGTRKVIKETSSSARKAKRKSRKETVYTPPKVSIRNTQFNSLEEDEEEEEEVVDGGSISPLVNDSSEDEFLEVPMTLIK